MAECVFRYANRGVLRTIHQMRMPARIILGKITLLRTFLKNVNRMSMGMEMTINRLKCMASIILPCSKACNPRSVPQPGHL